MRIRRKKNLEQRLESCDDYLIKIEYGSLNFDEQTDDDRLCIDCGAIFGNDNPVELEIGCGKGSFICELAQRRPDTNYIAIEKAGSIIVDACDAAMARGLKNVRFLKLTAEYLYRYLPPDSVNAIYLNFSCPYPKKAYADHRLTSERFLRIYERILAPGGSIFQKTDNMHFFEYSIESFSACGFALKNIVLDLYSSEKLADNIPTEYERRFVEQGKPIYSLEAYIR